MNGEAIAEDEDPRSAGIYSGNYIWEEKSWMPSAATSTLDNNKGGKSSSDVVTPFHLIAAVRFPIF